MVFMVLCGLVRTFGKNPTWWLFPLIESSHGGLHQDSSKVVALNLCLHHHKREKTEAYLRASHAMQMVDLPELTIMGTDSRIDVDSLGSIITAHRISLVKVLLERFQISNVLILVPRSELDFEMVDFYMSQIISKCDDLSMTSILATSIVSNSTTTVGVAVPPLALAETVPLLARWLRERYVKLMER
ncbi:hypothetical protein ACLB2K_040979 [Fragaria x ananassa]